MLSIKQIFPQKLHKKINLIHKLNGNNQLGLGKSLLWIHIQNSKLEISSLFCQFILWWNLRWAFTLFDIFVFKSLASALCFLPFILSLFNITLYMIYFVMNMFLFYTNIKTTITALIYIIYLFIYFYDKMINH